MPRHSTCTRRLTVACCARVRHLQINDPWPYMEGDMGGSDVNDLVFVPGGAAPPAAPA